MALSVGIVGLPNVGKSTIFNALTRQSAAEAANYPFCTIEPNQALVPVPDARLAKLSELVNPKKTVAATVEFVDIAGLVKGASAGEGLGNQFLGNIRQTGAILQVARCFADDDITHVENSVDPRRDVEIIELELIIADHQQLEKKLETLQKKARADKTMRPQVALAEKLLAHLAAEKPAASFPGREKDLVRDFFREMGFLTAKPMIYCGNVDEAGLSADNEHFQALTGLAKERGARALKICAKMEEELGTLDEAERAEYLSEFGIADSGLAQVIRAGYDILRLQSYFTAGEKEVKAWTIPAGCKAPQAAGVIHTDFAKGFIRAEVIAYADYLKHGGEAGAKAAGVMRVEGKDYVLADGDVLHFRFNV